MTTRDRPVRYDSSAGELSSPPSGELSEPASPSRRGKRQGEDVHMGDEHQVQRRKIEAETPPAFEKYQTVSSGGNGPPKRYGLLDGQWIPLTAAGMPRKKPGRKPGAIPKPKDKAENGEEDQQPGKTRKPRKPRDSTEGSTSRKRKVGSTEEEDPSQSTVTGLPVSSISGLNSRANTASYQSPEFSQAKLSNSPVQRHLPTAPENTYSPPAKRESGYPSSMKSILNDDTPSFPSGVANNNNSTSIPVRTSGQNYDPIRGNYDPIRGTYSTSGSPRGPAVSSNRSPSIASLIEPTAAQTSSATQKVSHPTSAPRFKENNSVPSSPGTQPAKPRPANTTAIDLEKTDAPPPPPPNPKPVIRESNFTTIANGPVKKVDKVKGSTSVSTPKTDTIDDFGGEGDGRSILDFGKAKPGEELQAPTIVLSIPITAGETNKYINFTRLAEERYGWDALHPRLAANRDRKARIAAATATLEKEARESGDEMSVDLSDAEASNPENGGTSNPDVPAKPKKKRNFKEDQYDIDDDFVDDSDLLWEAQAAASRDGFFVYSGPLVPEEEKPAAGQEVTTKRGRGGRGSRGGRGGGAAARGGSGTGRGGGPGSRGGSVTRKPRITKSEKAQREKEKAERENLALSGKSTTNGYVLQTPALAVSEVTS